MTSTETISPSIKDKITSLLSKKSQEQAPPSESGNYLLDFENFKNSDKGAQLVAWVKTRFERCKSDRLSVQRQWDINYEMYLGRQWVEVAQHDNGGYAIRTPPVPRYRVRSTTNLIRPLIRTEVARQTSQQPTAFVIPGSSNETAIFAAQGGETVWKSILERKDFQSAVMNDAAFWNSITGNGFIKEVWNATMSDPTLQMQNPDSSAALMGQQYVPAVGDVDIGSVRPYNMFFPDLSAKDIEDQPYTFEAYMKPVEWVKKFFKGMITGDLTPNNGARTDVEPRSFKTNGNDSANNNSLLVIECFIKPGGCEYFPEGGMVTLVGNELAQVAQTYPFTHGEYPYAHIRHIPTGKFYGDSVLVDVNPLQREYNGTRSHVIESKRLMAKPQLLVPKGSMQTHKYTSEPGALIEFLPGLGEPRPLAMQALPQYVLEEFSLIKSDMDDISGQHAPSRGMAPGQGVTAATAIAFLQEKDDNIMTPTYDSIESAVQKIARHTLLDVQERWDIPRIVRVTGMDGAFDAIELKGSDISTDIKVESGSALPQSRPARQAFLMELAQNGFITPPMLLDLLDMGGLQKLTEQIRIDMNQARRENLRMKKLTAQDIMGYNQEQVQQQQMGTNEQAPNGQPLNVPDQQGNFDPALFPPMVEVHDYDNHEVHVQTHNNYRKSPEFETLDDSVKQEFQKHIRLHEAYMQSQMMQQAMQGIGGPPPEQGGQQAPPPDAGSGGGGQPPPQDPTQQASQLPQGGGM